MAVTLIFVFWTALALLIRYCETHHRKTLMSHAFDLARIARTGAPVVDTCQALRDLPIYDGVAPRAVATKGAQALADRGGGHWEWDAASEAADNVGTVLLPTGHSGPGRWIRIYDGKDINAGWWGLTDGGVVNCAPEIQAAIDYAGTIAAATSSSQTPGVAVLIPLGTFLVLTPIMMQVSGISLTGTNGRGGELTGPGTIIKIGDANNPDVFVTGCGLYDLVITSSAMDNIESGIVLYNTQYCEIVGCEIFGFNVLIDCINVRKQLFSQLRMDSRGRTATGLASIRFGGKSTAVTTSTCGDIHIDACQFTGSAPSATFLVSYGLLILSCDGLYVSQCHFARFGVAVSMQPPGTAENFAIASIFVNNTYFDEPVHGGVACRNTEIVGTVKKDILIASGALVKSIYTTILFNNCEFRAASNALQGVFINVLDFNGWSTLYELDSIQINNCTFRGHLESAIYVPITNAVAPAAVLINNDVFIDFNQHVVAGLGGAITLRGGSLVITSCVFNSGIYTSDYIIYIGSPTDSITIESNNLCKAVATTQDIRINANTRIPKISAVGNLLNGGGRLLDLVRNKETIDATPAFPYVHYTDADTCGHLDVIVSALGPAGTSYSCRFIGAWRRTTGGISLYNATTSYTIADEWNPDAAIVTAPTLRVSGNNIVLTVTGIAGQTWNWGVRVKSLEPK